MLTCLISQKLGSGSPGSTDHYPLRDLAAALLHRLCTKYSRFAHNLKPRLLHVCLKNFLTPKKPLGTYYGAIIGLHAVGGPEIVRTMIIPNLKSFEELYRDDLENNGSGKREEAEKVVSAILTSLHSLVDEDMPIMNGHSDEAAANIQSYLVDKVGEVIGSKVAESGYTPLIRAVHEA